jgi:hypothetical protein
MAGIMDGSTVGFDASVGSKLGAMVASAISSIDSMLCEDGSEEATFVGSAEAVILPVGSPVRATLGRAVGVGEGA